MKIIVGLGNPGNQYTLTRHNAGFRVVDKLASLLHTSLDEHGRDRVARGESLVDGEKVLLIKPLTYMNDSGQAVGPLVNFYKLPITDLLVIADDLDLPVGRIRLREKGSDGGQRGIRSIIAALGTDQFARLRVGIGRPAERRMETVAYVLAAPPAGEERDALDAAEARAAEAARIWLRLGTRETANQYNAEPRPPAEHSV